MVIIVPIIIGVIKLVGKENKFMGVMFRSVVEGKKLDVPPPKKKPAMSAGMW
jgi:hypothetical protein